MLYLMLSFILIVWAWRTVAREPLKPYVVLYVLLPPLAHAAELVTVGFFRLYTFPGGLSAHPFRDTRISGTIAEYIIFPLFACLFCYYAARRSSWWVVAASLAVSATEVLFVAAGQVRYHHWSLAYSFPFYLGFFWLSQLLFNHYRKVPPWLLGFGTASTILAATDLLLHGGFWLWHYPLHFWRDEQTSSRIFGYFFNEVVAAVAAYGIWAGQHSGWVRRLAVPWLIIMAMSLFLLANGLRVYHGWNLIYEGARIALIVWAADRVRAWFDQRSPVPSP